MTFRVSITAGSLRVVDTTTDADSSMDALSAILHREDVAQHLKDLRFSSLRAEVVIAKREEVAA